MMKKWKKAIALLLASSMFMSNVSMAYASFEGGGEAADYVLDERVLDDNDGAFLSGKTEHEAEVKIATDSEAEEDLAKEQFAITYTVYPEDAGTVTGPEEILGGKNLKFTVKPEEGYEIKEVLADGEVLTEANGSWFSGRNKKYELRHIDQDREIEVYLREKDIAPRELTVESEDGFIVKLEALEDGALSDIKEMEVELLPEGPEKEAAYRAVKEAVETEAADKEVADYVPLDITLYDADGNKAEPSGKVRVTVSGLELPEEYDEAVVYHMEEADTASKNKERAVMPSALMRIGEDGAAGAADNDPEHSDIYRAEKIDTEKAAKNSVKESEEICFTTDHFSIYTIVFIKGGGENQQIKLSFQRGSSGLWESFEPTGTLLSEDAALKIKAGESIALLQTLTNIQATEFRAGGETYTFSFASYDSNWTEGSTEQQYTGSIPWDEIREDVLYLYYEMTSLQTTAVSINYENAEQVEVADFPVGEIASHAGEERYTVYNDNVYAYEEAVLMNGDEKGDTIVAIRKTATGVYGVTATGMKILVTENTRIVLNYKQGSWIYFSVGGNDAGEQGNRVDGRLAGTTDSPDRFRVAAVRNGQLTVDISIAQGYDIMVSAYSGSAAYDSSQEQNQKRTHELHFRVGTSDIGSEEQPVKITFKSKKSAAGKYNFHYAYLLQNNAQISSGWRFNKYLIDGKPVSSGTSLEISDSFHLQIRNSAIYQGYGKIIMVSIAVNGQMLAIPPTPVLNETAEASTVLYDEAGEQIAKVRLVSQHLPNTDNENTGGSVATDKFVYDLYFTEVSASLKVTNGFSHWMPKNTDTLVDPNSNAFIRYIGEGLSSTKAVGELMRVDNPNSSYAENLRKFVVTPSFGYYLAEAASEQGVDMIHSSVSWYGQRTGRTKPEAFKKGAYPVYINLISEKIDLAFEYHYGAGLSQVAYDTQSFQLGLTDKASGALSLGSNFSYTTADGKKMIAVGYRLRNKTQQDSVIYKPGESVLRASFVSFYGDSNNNLSQGSGAYKAEGKLYIPVNVVYQAEEDLSRYNYKIRILKKVHVTSPDEEVLAEYDAHGPAESVIDSDIALEIVNAQESGSMTDRFEQLYQDGYVLDLRASTGTMKLQQEGMQYDIVFTKASIATDFYSPYGFEPFSGGTLEQDGQTIRGVELEPGELLSGLSIPVPLESGTEHLVFLYWKDRATRAQVTAAPVEMGKTYEAYYAMDRNGNGIPDEEEYVTVIFCSDQGFADENQYPGVEVRLSEEVPGVDVQVPTAKDTNDDQVVFKGWEKEDAAHPEVSGAAPNEIIHLPENAQGSYRYTAIYKPDVNNNGIADDEETGYRVVYDGNGDDGNGNVPQDDVRYVSGQSVTVLGNPGNLSHVSVYTDADSSKEIPVVFLGWSREEQDTILTINDEYPTDILTEGNTFVVETVQGGAVEEEIRLYAVWAEATNHSEADINLPEAQKYRVTYNQNGSASEVNGNVPTDNSYYAVGRSTKVKGNIGTPALAHHDTEEGTRVVFAGWSTEAVTKILTVDDDPSVITGGGAQYFSGADITAEEILTFGNGNVTLYAVWAESLDGVNPDFEQADKYNFIYDANGGIGTVPQDEKKYIEGSTGQFKDNDGNGDDTQKLTHVAENGTAVVFVGWSSTASTYGKMLTVNDKNLLNTVYTKDDWFSLGTASRPEAGKTYVELPAGNNILYAVWGLDTDGNGVPDILEQSYSLSYHGNGQSGGSVPTDANPYVSGMNANVQDNIGALTHADTTEGITVVFAGWSTQQITEVLTADNDVTAITGGGAEYFSSADIAAGAQLTFGRSDKDLYAVWAEATDGANPDFEQTDKYRLVYDKNETGGTGNGNVSGAVPVDGHLYVNGRQAELRSNDGNGDASQVLTHGDTAEGVTVVFAGWSTKKVNRVLTVDDNASILTENGEKYFRKASLEAGGQKLLFSDSDVTLYAVWAEGTDGVTPDFERADRYHVTYEANSGTGTVPQDSKDYLGGSTGQFKDNDGNGDDTQKLTHVAENGTAVVFVGWSSTASTYGKMLTVNDKNLLNTVYTKDDWFSLGTASRPEAGKTYVELPSENITLYAVWGLDTDGNGVPDVRERSYGLSYHGNGENGGAVPTDSNQYVSGMTVSVLGNLGSLTHADTVEGVAVVFAGWSTQQITEVLTADNDVTAITGGGAEYFSSADIAAGVQLTFGSSDKELYAVWAEATDSVRPDFERSDKYSIRYDANGGTGTVPRDENKYVEGRKVYVRANDGNGDEAQKLRHSDVNGVQIVFAGWSEVPYGEVLTDDNSLFAVKDAIGFHALGDASGSFTMGDEDVILYAVYGEDTNGNGVADALEKWVILTFRAGYGFYGFAEDVQEKSVRLVSGSALAGYVPKPRSPGTDRRFDGWNRKGGVIPTYAPEEDTIYTAKYYKEKSDNTNQYTTGIHGNWVHMSPDDLNVPMQTEVIEGADAATAPEYHRWRFMLNNGTMLYDCWAYIENPYAGDGQPQRGWFHFGNDGIMHYGWYYERGNGKWYYLHGMSDGMLGTMMEGWHYDKNDGRWYYLKPGSGEMLLGWQEIDGEWYYLSPDPVAETWSLKEDGKYYFNGSADRPYGSMYKDEETPDGYRVDENGAWLR